MPVLEVGTHRKALDDWVWKKGQTYGTILVELEKRCTIDLLADRKEETLTAWLLLHPQRDAISRGRGGEYAAAAKKAAPQAQPIADTFPLVKTCVMDSKSRWRAGRKYYRKWKRSPPMAFLSEHRENDGRVFSQKHPG